MQQESDSPEHHRRRSEFIRELVQRPLGQRSINNHCRQPTPRTIVQFWHYLGQLPPDVEECVRSWAVWEASGFKHKLFDERTAGLSSVIRWVRGTSGLSNTAITQRCRRTTSGFATCWLKAASMSMRTMCASVPTSA